MDNIKLQINPDGIEADPELLTAVGYACENGTIFHQNYPAALAFYKAAAEAGDAQALNNIGWMF